MSHDPPETTPGASSKAPRVLIAEDEPAILRGYQRVLQTAGFEVETASDGESAAELLAAGHFDVLISDIEMPRLNGLALLKRVHQLHPDMPFVLITATPTLDGAVFAVEHGAFRYMVKPVSAAVLVKIATNAVALGAAARAQRAAHTRVELDEVGAAALGRQFDGAMDGLWMAYQPIVRTATNQIVAYEALVRTSDSSVPHPGVFLELGERLGRLPELGRKIRAAVAQAIDDDPFDAFVNLHPADLNDESLFAVDAPLSRHARRVVLEITERQSLENIGQVQQRMAALRRMGFRLAIDDLGAGYAGLSSIVTLNPEIIKIDMSLVRGIDASPLRRALVRSLVDMAHSIHAEVVAEGIETPAERAVLVELQCNFLQGYLLGRPAKVRQLKVT